MDNITVLYIEDAEQEAFIMRAGMRRLGITIVHILPTEPDLLSTLRTPPHDTAAAIIVDAILVAIDGLDLVQALREAGDTRRLILLTAGTNPDPDLLEALDVIYLRKPVNFNALAEMIRG
jgi:DNA-binding response OmpR family regulator